MTPGKRIIIYIVAAGTGFLFYHMWGIESAVIVLLAWIAADTTAIDVNTDKPN